MKVSDDTPATRAGSPGRAHGAIAASEHRGELRLRAQRASVERRDLTDRLARPG